MVNFLFIRISGRKVTVNFKAQNMQIICKFNDYSLMISEYTAINISQQTKIGSLDGIHSCSK